MENSGQDRVLIDILAGNPKECGGDKFTERGCYLSPLPTRDPIVVYPTGFKGICKGRSSSWDVP